MGSRLRAVRSIVVVCLMCIGARPRSTSEANPVGTASPPVRRRCNSYVLLWWRVLLLLLHCGHIITVTWKSCAPRREPIPSGRSPAGFPLGICRSAHRLPRATCAQFLLCILCYCCVISASSGHGVSGCLRDPYQGSLRSCALNTFSASRHGSGGRPLHTELVPVVGHTDTI